MTDSTAIVDFLNARLDEQAENVESVHDFGCGEIKYDGTCNCGWPEQITAGIEAKRRLLAAHARSHECIKPPDDGEGTALDGRIWHAWGWNGSRPCFVIRCLASEFATHDGYRRAVLIAHGQDPDLPPRGVSHGDPPPGPRNWVCEVDGHEDPDLVGSCLHCYAELP